MKKKIIISLLVVSFFNYIGCYSYYTLTEDEINAGRPYPDDEIRLVLNDSLEIECIPLLSEDKSNLRYLKVTDSVRTLSGTGGIFDLTTHTGDMFTGTIPGYMIDSSRSITVDSKKYSVFWTEDNKRFSFQQGEFIDFYPQLGTGYYIWQNEEMERIPFDNIKEIQVDNFNLLNTYLLIGAIAGIILITVWAAMGFEEIGNLEGL